jgi:hypothetical protein
MKMMTDPPGAGADGTLPGASGRIAVLAQPEAIASSITNTNLGHALVMVCSFHAAIVTLDPRRPK